MSKPRLFQNLVQEWSSCTKCDLHKCNVSSEQNPSGKAFGRGALNARILLVGETLGRQESETGLVFYPEAPAGRKLEEILSYYKLQNKCFITNPTACRSTTKGGKNIKPPISAFEACRERFEQTLKIVRPKLIVAMGAFATECLTGEKIPILRNIGRIFETRYGKVIVVPHVMNYIYRSKDKDLIEKSHAVWKYIAARV